MAKAMAVVGGLRHHGPGKAEAGVAGLKALVIYSSEGRLAPLAGGVKRGLEQGGWNVEVVAASRSEARPLPGGFD
ncbi:MAG: hypothetical protein ACM3VX_09620, partial [Bacteroidota bacterium]